MYVMTLTHLEIILPSGKRETGDATLCMFHLYDIARVGKSNRGKSRLVFAKDWTNWVMEKNQFMDLGFHFLGNENELGIERR